MKQKLLLIAALLAPTAFSYAQSTIITNKGDKVNIEDLKVEPWNVVNGTTKASSNTQNIYQNGNVAIGNYNTTSPTSSLEIRTNTTSHFGLVNSNNDSKFDFSKEPNALTITTRRPTNNRIFNLYTDGSLYLGTVLNNDDVNAGSNIGAGFVFQSTTNRLGINLPNNQADPVGNGLPTQTLDLGGNARVRALANGGNSTDFPRVVVAKTDGTLGYADRAAFGSNTGTNSAAQTGFVKGIYLAKTVPIDVGVEPYDVSSNVGFTRTDGNPNSSAPLINGNGMFASVTRTDVVGRTELTFTFSQPMPDLNFEVMVAFYSYYTYNTSNDIQPPLVTNKTANGFQVYLEQNQNTTQAISIVATVHVF